MPSRRTVLAAGLALAGLRLPKDDRTRAADRATKREAFAALVRSNRQAVAHIDLPERR